MKIKNNIAVLFTILSNPELNILANVKDATYRDVRKNVIRCIIGTDMAKHGDIMGAFKKAAESFNYDDVEHKTLVGCWCFFFPLTWSCSLTFWFISCFK